MTNHSLSASGKSDPKQEEKLARRDAARTKVLNGSIGALSIDTCIFTDAGYRLEGGIFKTLEQFKGNAFSLVFSEVTISEVHRHMAKKADDDKTALISTLRSFGKSWLLPQDEQLRTTAALLAERTGRSIATERIKNFAQRCGISIVRASKALDVDALLKSYFHTKALFEGSADKKSEFPDAIALLSLQGWALQNNTSVLFVTKDKGCQAFCAESDFLVAIDELDDALALIQERQKVLTLELCKKAEALFADEDDGDLLEELRDAVDSQIWDVSWIPEAESADYYEPEMQSVDVLNAEFVWSGESPKFRAVEYNGTELVAQATVSIEFDATCNFAFSTKDGVDKDMVPIGDAMVTKRSRATVEVLLSFDIGERDSLSLSSIELMSSRCTVDFGFVEPDYSQDDPNEEDY